MKRWWPHRTAAAREQLNAELERAVPLDVTTRTCYCPSLWQRTNRAISARSTWPGGQVNFAHLRAAVRLAVRFLDDVIDVNRCPVPELEGPARATRKMGLGVMGLAEAVLGVRSRRRHRQLVSYLP